jgi:flagellar motor switch protein FliN/FliY
MSLQDDLRANSEVASALASALDATLGRQTPLTIGEPHATIAEVPVDEEARAVALEFDVTEDVTCVLALIATSSFARTLEAAAPDEVLLTATAPAFAAAAASLARLAQASIDDATEDAREVLVATLAAQLGDDAVVYPLLDDTEPVACVALHTRAPAERTATGSVTAGGHNALTQTASMTGAPLVLADVEMGVTAELGRARTTLRELLSITPGMVIDLDRAAGSPVDLLVNGTVIARGEVVVIDEEFGVRITELLSGSS